MSGLLYPRLARELARPRIAPLRDSSPADLLARVNLLVDDHTYSPIGGRQVTEEELSRLLLDATRIARECGFPEERREAARISFDRRMAKFLHERMQLTPHQAADEEIWTHLTLGPLAALAAWRFPGLPDDRVIGRGPRNTFRRLWWRAETLGSLAWEEGALQEDETVQIMERTYLTASPVVARALAAAFRRRIAASPEVRRMDLMRDALKRVNRLTPFTTLEALEEVEIAQQLDEAFAAAAAAIGGASVEPVPAPPPAAGRPETILAEVDGDFRTVPLGQLGQWIVEVVAARGEVGQSELAAALRETRGVSVPPERRRLLSKLAWSARGRGQLSFDEATKIWTPGSATAEVDERFGDWTYGLILSRAEEMLGEDPEPFDRLVAEVGGDGRAPRVVASVVGTAINEARQRRRRI
jgi:hypothetical protein